MPTVYSPLSIAEEILSYNWISAREAEWFFLNPNWFLDKIPSILKV